MQALDFLIDKYVDHYRELGYEGLKRARFESQKAHGIIPKDAPYPSTANNELLRPWSELSDEEKDREAVPPSGVSMRGFLEGRAPQPRTEEQWFAFELFGNSYIVAGDYKAIRVRTGMYGDGKWHLYDIKKDPGETRALDSHQRRRLKRMIRTYGKYAKDKGIVPVADAWNPWHGFPEDAQKN